MKFLAFFLPIAVFAVPVYVPIHSVSSTSTAVIDSTTNIVTTDIMTQVTPYIGVFSPDGAFLYLANNAGVLPGAVSVISVPTNTVIATIPTGVDPQNIAISPNGSKVYVANNSGSSVTVIDTATNSVAATVATGTQPQGLSVTPNGQRVYVPNFGSGTVSVIDTSSNTVIKTITVGTSPQYTAISPDGARVYVSNAAQNTVSVIDTGSNTVIATIPVGTTNPSNPRQIAITPDGSKVYVATDHVPGGGGYAIIDPVSLTATSIPFPVGNPFTVTITPDGRYAYFVGGLTTDAYIVDTSTNLVVNHLTFSQRVLSVRFLPDGTFGYVNSTVSNEVYVINPVSQTVVATITVGTSPFSAIFAPLPGPVTSLAGTATSNRFLTQEEFVNILTWSAPQTGSSFIGYNIYRDAALTNLAGFVSASGPLQFQDHNLNKGWYYSYYVVAVDQEGHQSQTAASIVLLAGP